MPPGDGASLLTGIHAPLYCAFRFADYTDAPLRLRTVPVGDRRVRCTSLCFQVIFALLGFAVFALTSPLPQRA